MPEESNQNEPKETEARASALRFALPLVAAAAILFGVLAQNLLFVGLGLLLAIAAFRLLPDSLPVVTLPAAAMLASGALLLSAVAAYQSYQDARNPAIPYLWLGSMALALVAAVRFDRALPASAAASRLQRTAAFSSVFWLIPIILLAFALRVHNLEAYPPFHGDEGEMGLAALDVLAGDAPPPTVTGWLDHPALFHYLQAVPLAMIGRNGFGLRLLSVMAGVLCVPLVYVLGRRWWGPIAGLAAACFLAVAHLHVHFSRLGLNNIESTLFLLLFLVLMTLVRPQRVTVYLLAGVTVGLAQYMYFGSRVIMIIAAVLLLFTWRRKLTTPRQLAVFGAGFLLAVLPLTIFFARNPDPFVSRARGVFVMSGDNVKHILDSDQASLPGDVLPMLSRQLQRNVSFFAGAGDRSPFYIAEVPGLDMLTTVLFWLGLALALTRLFRLPEVTVLLVFGLGLLFGGVLTIDAPNAPRLLIVMPAVALLAALVLWRAHQLLSTYPQWAKALLLVGVFALTAMLNTRIYFADFERSLPIGNLGVDSIAREIRSAGDADGIYLLGQPILYANYGTLQFLGGETVQDLAGLDDVASSPGTDLLFIALPSQDETLAAVKQRWPGGRSLTHRSDQEVPLFNTYRVQVP